MWHMNWGQRGDRRPERLAQNVCAACGPPDGPGAQGEHHTAIRRGNCDGRGAGCGHAKAFFSLARIKLSVSSYSLSPLQRSRHSTCVSEATGRRPGTCRSPPPPPTTGELLQTSALSLWRQRSWRGFYQLEGGFLFFPGRDELRCLLLAATPPSPAAQQRPPACLPAFQPSWWRLSTMN